MARCFPAGARSVIAMNDRYDASSTTEMALQPLPPFSLPTPYSGTALILRSSRNPNDSSLLVAISRSSAMISL
jgi:hypothetical protein